MSADNWSVCPKCHDAYERKLIKFDEMVTRSYGKVPPEEYDRLRKERALLETQEEPTSLREDYEQGIMDGEYYLRYSAHCQTCGWEFAKSIDQVVYPNIGTEKH